MEVSNISKLHRRMARVHDRAAEEKESDDWDD